MECMRRAKEWVRGTTVWTRVVREIEQGSRYLWGGYDGS